MPESLFERNRSVGSGRWRWTGPAPPPARQGPGKAGKVRDLGKFLRRCYGRFLPRSNYPTVASRNTRVREISSRCERKIITKCACVFPRSKNILPVLHYHPGNPKIIRKFRHSGFSFQDSGMSGIGEINAGISGLGNFECRNFRIRSDAK